MRDRNGEQGVAMITVMTTLVTVVRLVVAASELSRKLNRPEVATSPRPTIRVAGVGGLVAEYWMYSSSC